uniref:Uncharacterized protein AlNc14C33G3008 n=1 Tax=Albugo laibachii Nc14 TaxID=890382 RepID=F0W8B4_9STRA|nr:hypothetical protein PITG_06232 [Albugo laibachii Nc14]|eukprot:CCA17314.1 hypothetical protein PITG_06232 [Albugo laibachii Nc14]
MDNKVYKYMRVTKRLSDASKKKLKKNKEEGRYSFGETPQCSSDENECLESVDDSGQYVPRFIYRTVKYTHKKKKTYGENRNSAVELTLRHIEKYYQIPSDLEQNHKFGPHSGMDYNSRLIRAFTLDLLEPKTSQDKNHIPGICISCGDIGHTQRYCPDAF